MIKPRADASRATKAQGTSTPGDDSQLLARMMELATDTKGIADHLGEKFLGYLLAMAIQEISHVAIRRSGRGNAGSRMTRETPARPAD